MFVLPGVLFVVSMVIFPILFGIYISLTDWNLSSLTGRKFNGIDNFVQMAGDPFYWNALKNMVYYVLAISVEYAIAFGSGPPPQRPDPRAKILPRGVPASPHALAGGGELDGGEVDDGDPLRPARQPWAVPGLGDAVLLRDGPRSRGSP